MADEQAERTAADQLVQGGEIVLAMKRGFVHGRAPARGASGRGGEALW